MGAGLAVLFGMGLLLLAGSGGRRRTGEDLCSVTPATAARYSRARLREWIDCTGRTAADVDAVVAAIPASRSSDRDFARRRWAARRAVEDAPADGRMTPGEASSVQEAVTSPTPPASVPEAPPGHAGSGRGGAAGSPNPTLARSLVSRLVPRLRERRNYRSLLRQFQTAAGIPSDGIYGGLSENALRYYGGDPPAAFRRPPASDPSADYRAYLGRVHPGAAPAPAALPPADMEFPAEGEGGGQRAAVAGVDDGLDIIGAMFGPTPEPFTADEAGTLIVGGEGAAESEGV